MREAFMLVIDNEANEWARMAQAAYASGRNSIGHRYSVAATWRSKQMPLRQWDSLQADYRSWLIDGWKFFDDLKTWESVDTTNGDETPAESKASV